MSAVKILASGPMAAGMSEQAYGTFRYTTREPPIREPESVDPSRSGGPPPPDPSTEADPAWHDGVFDEVKFREFVGDDDAVVVKVVRSFLSDTPGRLAGIRAALSTGDAATVRRIAHTLKGSVGFFAAVATLDAARAVETVAGTGDLPGAAAAGAVLEGEIARLTAALAAFLACTLGRARS